MYLELLQADDQTGQHVCRMQLLMQRPALSCSLNPMPAGVSKHCNSIGQLSHNLGNFLTMITHSTAARVQEMAAKVLTSSKRFSLVIPESHWSVSCAAGGDLEKSKGTQITNCPCKPRLAFTPTAAAPYNCSIPTANPSLSKLPPDTSFLPPAFALAHYPQSIHWHRDHCN